MTASPQFNYGRYLASRDWALLKNQVRERSGGMCERCQKEPYQETHHLTYERIGHEDVADLLGVCKPCHAFLSGRSDDDPAFEKESYPSRDDVLKILWTIFNTAEIRDKLRTDLVNLIVLRTGGTSVHNCPEWLTEMAPRWSLGWLTSLHTLCQVWDRAEVRHANGREL